MAFPSVTLNAGERFGRFTIISKSEKRTKHGYRKHHLCKCDCGTIKHVDTYTLTHGLSKSCGCLVAEKHRLPPGESTVNERYAMLRMGARNRNYEFSISRQDHKNLIVQNCYFCGNEPTSYNHYLRKDGSISASSKTSKISQKAIDNAWIKSNSIDRLDNTKGYTLDNCVPACWPCNEMKMVRTEQEFIDHVEKIAKFQKSKRELQGKLR